LPLARIGTEIARYCATQPQLPAESHEEALLPEDEVAQLGRILAEVQRRTGQEFAMFKRAVVLQRIRHRMRLRHVRSLAEYLAVMSARTDEPRALCNDLLLNVTEFFRDAPTWESVERMLARIISRKQVPRSRVRIWSIGCSTGEEAYSLAMLLIE